MQPSEPPRPDDPRKWLDRAKSNLIRAGLSLGVRGIFLEHICFDAQQAAEQAFKAVLIANEVRFPKTHDITTLFALAEQHGVAIPGELEEAKRLTRYAAQTRYVSGGEPVTADECHRAIACAEAVVRWAEQMLEPADEERETEGTDEASQE